MNNRPENVPIATLSGLTSLSDVLGILPLPDEVQSEERPTNSLISTQQILQNARQMLNGEKVDNILIQKLQYYLSKINTSYLDFKSPTGQKNSDLNKEQIPMLLQQLLVNAPHIFTPNYEQYASPSKFMNTDFAAPRHSLLKPHGPQLILSPTRSGSHIPVAHVSPLRQDPPNLVGVPPAIVRATASQDHQLSLSRNRRSHDVEARNKQPVPPQASMLHIQPRQYQQELTANHPSSSQTFVHRHNESKEQVAENQDQTKERWHINSQLASVRRQLYSPEKSMFNAQSSVQEARTSQNFAQECSQDASQINIETDQGKFMKGQGELHNNAQNAAISPRSLKVSINRSELRGNPVKSPRQPHLAEDSSKREYPKRRRIGRLSYIESGNESGKQPIGTGSVDKVAERSCVERDNFGTYLQENKVDDEVPVDILLLNDISKDLRPVIPKLVLKRVKRKEGSKEFETMEIVSPTKAELGMYYNDEEIKGVSADGDSNDKRRKSDSSAVEKNDKDIEGRSIDTRLNVVQKQGLQDSQVVYLEEEIRLKETQAKIRVDISTCDGDLPRNEDEEEQRVPELSEGRSLRRKRRRVSSESEGGEEEFTDTMPVYGVSSKKEKTSKALQLDEEIEVRVDTKRLIQLLQEMLNAEEELQAEGVLDFGEDDDIPEDALLPRPIITDFYIEISKLRSANLASELPHDQLVRIVSIMDRHVKDSLEVLLNQAKQVEDEEEKLWKALKMDRVLRACEASLVILHITTAPGMPKQVYMEEVIERLVSFCRFQLENTIYPEYDPVYRVDPESKFDSSIMLPKSRRARSVNSTKLKPILQLYNKLCQLVSLIGDLVAMENLTDIIILKISSIGTTPFFVENVSFLQLEALKLVRTIFRTYVKHRDLILDDILASLARLPSSKRNIRNYRLIEDTSIQMVTALVLQLVQCTVSIPDSFDKKEDSLVDKDVMIVTSYEDSLRAAQNFLATFLKKCSSASKDENDFRPLFENFLQDILTTLNKPEWPAAEVLLTLLGKLLILTFNNKSNEMSLRVAAMDYLALIASHLRRDAVESRGRDKNDLKEIIEQLHRDDEIEEKDDLSVDMIDVHINTLRKALLSYLALSSENDVSCKFSREFYLGQWIRDVHVELEKCMKAPMMSIPGAAATEIPTDDSGDVSIENIQELDDRKKYYHSMATEKITITFRSSQQKITYEEACIIAKYLTSSRSFCQSFDIYLQQIFKMLNETAVALRTKAVKALTSIVSVDPNILEREDVQISVHCRFRDQSTLVREAAVDLIGHFILQCPHLTDKYYEMIIERILDTGISVRKRVIKILRDICIEQSDFPKAPEICIKMIRRINDEEGIRDLVTKVFQKMWFTPVTGIAENSEELSKKAQNIMKVVAMCKDCGYEWLENLLDHLLEGDDDGVRKSTEKACQQLVGAFIQRLLKTEQENGSELVACLTTLYFMCKIRPQLLVQYTSTLQPYLSIKCSTQGDALVIQNVAKILENVIPLMDHPNPKFLADLEEDLMKLIIKQGQNIVQSCISCLDAVVNQVTRNYSFIVDCFKKFHAFLEKAKKDISDSKQKNKLNGTRPALLRSLFIAGLLCKHFDFDKHMNQDKKNPISLQVLGISLFFANHSDEEIRLKAIMAVGFVCMNKPEYLLRNDCKNLYQSILSENYNSARGKCMLLKSLQNHLMEEETRMTQLEGRKKKGRKQKNRDDDGNIKEFGDSQSGTTSAVMQVMLKSILETFFHADAMVRFAAVQVIALILRQGLIHPAQCVPYLIAASTDDDKMIKAKAEQSLTDIHKRHAGFIHMKAVQGIKLSFKLQRLIQFTDGGYLQGYRESDSRNAFASHVYAMLRPNKQYRRPLLQTILKQFDDQKNAIDLLYFLADNLAYLPYVTQEEPLFVMHHCDMMVSVTGAGYLQSFKEIFFPSRKDKGKGKSPSHPIDEDDNEDIQKLGDALTELKRLEEVVRESFCCMLLLELKQHLKQLYGFADSKCQKYSPSEPSKLYDKTMTRRGDVYFNSHFKDLMFNKKSLEKEEMVHYYIEFNQLMLSLDSEEDSEESETKEKRNVENASHCEEEPLNVGKQETGEEKAEVVQPSASGNVESKENAENTETKVEDDIKVKLEGMDDNHLNHHSNHSNPSNHPNPPEHPSHSEILLIKQVDDDSVSEASSSSKSKRRKSKSKQ